MTFFQICYSSKKIKFLIFSCIILVFGLDLLHAQNSNFSPNFFFERSLSVQKRGMFVLGTWASLNILTGSTGSIFFNKERKYFSQMNAAWNSVNLGIAAFGFYAAQNADTSLLSIEIAKELSKFETILLVNAGLDILYVSVGSWLWKKGLNNSSPRHIGYGKSIVLQGTFLLIFDTVLYLSHHQITKNFELLGGQFSLTPSGFKFMF